MKKDFQCFLESLKEAVRRIDRHYFQLDVADSKNPIYRERVYCYELYHQLRCILGNSFQYKLDGEIDKRAHPIIEPELGAKKPDFIVHMPGEMDRNLVIMEVKSVNVKDKINKLRKDLKTLKGFLDKAGYYRAIMLIYGNGKQGLPQEIRDEIKNFSKNHILLAWHPCAKKRLKVFKG